MFLTIITPCSRPGNLHAISESIHIPRDQYRWIVVFDSETIPSNIPYDCEPYAVKVKGSIMGNGQRNYALDLIEDGYVYFNDDDTTMHPELWDNVQSLTDDMIVFSQSWKDGRIRLKGDVVALNHTDSHNFIVRRDIVGPIRWILDKYDADGYFAERCKSVAKNINFIPKVLSTYNTLR